MSCFDVLSVPFRHRDLIRNTLVGGGTYTVFALCFTGDITMRLSVAKPWATACVVIHKVIHKVVNKFIYSQVALLSVVPHNEV